jgi:hypothetical protein
VFGNFCDCGSCWWWSLGICVILCTRWPLLHTSEVMLAVFDLDNVGAGFEAWSEGCLAHVGDGVACLSLDAGPVMGSRGLPAAWSCWAEAEASEDSTADGVGMREEKARMTATVS